MSSVTFKKIVHVEQEKEVTFQQVFYADGLRYRLTITDGNSRNINFHMYKDENNGQWKISPQILPDWVLNMEMSLNYAIREDLAKHTWNIHEFKSYAAKISEQHYPVSARTYSATEIEEIVSYAIKALKDRITVDITDADKKQIIDETSKHLRNIFHSQS